MSFAFVSAPLKIGALYATRCRRPPARGCAALAVVAAKAEASLAVWQGWLKRVEDELIRAHFHQVVWTEFRDAGRRGELHLECVQRRTKYGKQCDDC